MSLTATGAPCCTVVVTAQPCAACACWCWLLTVAAAVCLLVPSGFAPRAGGEHAKPPKAPQLSQFCFSISHKSLWTSFVGVEGWKTKARILRRDKTNTRLFHFSSPANQGPISFFWTSYNMSPNMACWLISICQLQSPRGDIIEKSYFVLLPVIPHRKNSDHVLILTPPRPTSTMLYIASRPALLSA